MSARYDVGDYMLNDDKADADAARDTEVERQVAAAWYDYLCDGHLPYGGGDVSLIDEESEQEYDLDVLTECEDDDYLLWIAKHIAEVRRRIIDKHIRRLVEANV